MEEKIYTIEFYGNSYDIKLRKERYASNNRPAIIAVLAEDGEPFCDLTVNLKTCIPDDGYVFLDTNNAPFSRSLFEDINLGTYTGVNGTSGFCRYPLMQLNMEKFNELKEFTPDTHELLYEEDEYKTYGPSNPWDAPGMRLSDFI